MVNIKESPKNLTIKNLSPDDLRKFNDKVEKVQEALIRVQKKNLKRFPPASGETLNKSYDY